MTAHTSEGASRQAVQALLDASVDAVVIVNRSGTIEAFSRAAEALFGHAAADAVGASVSLLMPDPHGADHDSHIGRYLATGQSRIIGVGREVLARRRDGSLFPARLALGQLEDWHRDGLDPRFVAFLHDLTPAHEAAERERRLAQQQADVERLAALSRLAGEIAHEVNQPLAAIANYAKACERLISAPPPEAAAHHGEVLEALRQISTQALRAGDSIRRLRELARQRGEVSAGSG